MRRLAMLALLALCAVAVGGCSDDDPGRGTPPIPVVSITSPEFEVHGSGPVTIQVLVDGCQPDTVDLLVDGEPFAVLVPPFQYTWDTTWAAEGRRVVTARAACGGSAGTSPPVAIHVDRTPPTVVDRTPAPSSASAWVRDPIAVTFSEAVDLASAREALVLRRNGSAVPATVSTSAGGERLTLVPAVPPSAGDAFEVEIRTGVRDLAGFPLVVPGDAWSYSYPAIVVRGPLSAHDASSYFETELSVNELGEPIAAWCSLFGLSLLSFGGDGTPLETYASRPDVWSCGVGVRNSDAYVVETAHIGNGWEVRLLRLSSSGALVPEGPAVTTIGSWSTSGVDVTFAPDGTPVVVWRDHGAEGAGPTQLRAAFLDAGVWSDRGTARLDVTDAWGSVVARDGQGRPAVAFIEGGSIHLKRWDGSGWSVVGPGPVAPSLYGSFALAFDGDDPYVAIPEYDAGYGIRVYHLVGGAWTALPARAGDPSRSVGQPSIALAAPGRPVVAWQQAMPTPTVGGTIFASQWSGTAWVPFGGALNRGGDYPGYGPSVAVDGSGSPVVLWSEPLAPIADGAMWNARIAHANR